MVSREELLDAIEECQNEPFTYAKCQKLADFITVYEFFFEPKTQQQKTIVKTIIETNGDSEFARAINGANYDIFMQELDNLMCCLKQLHPKMYDSFLRKVEN